MNINFSKIVTCDSISKLGQKRFVELEKIGKEERNMFNYSHPSFTSLEYGCTNMCYLPKKAMEVAFRTSRHKDLSVTEKLILETSFVYPDTNSFAEYLAKVYSLDDLEKISSLLKSYKKLALIYKCTNQDFNPDLTLVEPLLERLHIIYGNNPNHDGINKVNGILTFQKTLFK